MIFRVECVSQTSRCHRSHCPPFGESNLKGKKKNKTNISLITKEMIDAWRRQALLVLLLFQRRNVIVQESVDLEKGGLLCAEHLLQLLIE